MAAAALLSVTLVPALMVLFVRGRIIPEHKNPINRFLIWVYRPDHQGRAAREDSRRSLLALAALGATVWPARQLGTEFMPSLNEGTLMYMPTTLARACRSPRRRSFCRRRTGSSSPSRRWPRSTARRDAPRQRPIRRRPRCSRPIINLKPKSEWRPGVTIDEPQGRDGQGAAVPRRLERLDHADQGAHRHARDRHPHAGRRSRSSAPT